MRNFRILEILKFIYTIIPLRELLSQLKTIKIFLNSFELIIL